MTLGRNPSTRKPLQTSSMLKAQQYLVPIKGQTDCMATLCPQMTYAEQMLFLDWISRKNKLPTCDPSHPAQLTRAQWNTKSLKKKKPQCTFFSKASVKRIKMPNFSAWFYRGYLNTKQTVWKQTPCVCIQSVVLRLAASKEGGFFYKPC